MDTSGYTFNKRRDAADVWLQMDVAHKRQMSFNDLQRIAKAEGWSYRRGDMQADYRRFGSIEHSNTPEARERARNWYDTVAEPARKILKGKLSTVVSALKDAKHGNKARRAEIERGLSGDDGDGLRAWLDAEHSS